MIVTVTPNPSVDRTIAVDALVRGAVHRATSSRQDPGGKGLNVSRALALNGSQTVAVLPIGGHYGQMMLDLLDTSNVPTRPVRIAGSIRANIAIVEPDGATTKINEPGPVLSASDCAALVRETGNALGGSTGWVVGCGSLPPGVSDDFYGELIGHARSWGAKTVIDSSGAAMAAAMAAKPDLIKPNRIELAEVVGRDLPTLGAVVDAARDVVAGGIEQVLVSLGRDGAVLVTEDGVWCATARAGVPMSTVGAGDALLAGYLGAIAGGAPMPDALAQAVAFGAAAVALPGSEMPRPGDVAAAAVSVAAGFDRALPLAD